MLDIIKRAGVGAVEASQPVAVMFGTVTKLNPLEVLVEQRLPLSRDFLIVPKRFAGHFELGEKYSLIRVQGGNQFLILDEVEKD
ncbi:DUF2577 domain-containing protein [Bacillus chungangensis]|uniref:DUF2577 domain-containing protein n=1 Tax=Bacillus chungangensis TaxID=587633 RepID=A0ABT9WRY5_9BACI|nr:DUF2577 domain-containing protein [Bacillus chungangensis]MDQ0175977.1 hypothetical protein [Bacillus chungangensis]